MVEISSFMSKFEPMTLYHTLSSKMPHLKKEISSSTFRNHSHLKVLLAENFLSRDFNKPRKELLLNNSFSPSYLQATRKKVIRKSFIYVTTFKMYKSIKLEFAKKKKKQKEFKSCFIPKMLPTKQNFINSWE